MEEGEQIAHLVVFPAVVDAAGEDEEEETVGQQARKSLVTAAGKKGILSQIFLRKTRSAASAERWDTSF